MSIFQIASLGVYSLLALLSLVAIAIGLYKIMQFARLGVGRRAEAERILDDWLNGRVDEAISAAGRRRSVLSRILQAVFSGIQARPADVTKGEAVERLRGAGHLDVDALIVAGDDTTDESMFEALGERAQTVLVGERVSLARWRVGGPSDVRRLVGALADLRASGGS